MKEIPQISKQPTFYGRIEFLVECLFLKSFGLLTKYQVLKMSSLTFYNFQRERSDMKKNA